MNNKQIIKLEKTIKKIEKYNKITHGLKRSVHNFLKELLLFKNHITGSKKLGKNEKNHNISKVQIGGGKHFIPEFLNIDIIPPADIVYDVRENIPLSTNSVTLLFSEHFLEHIDYPTSVKNFIRECYRVIKKDGKIIIGVPDSRLVIENYIKKNQMFRKMMIRKWYSKRKFLNDINTYIDLVNYNFRDQDDDIKYNPHYWSYDFEKLKSLLELAGFTKIRKWKFDDSIANKKRKWGSIYVEAVK